MCEINYNGQTGELRIRPRGDIDHHAAEAMRQKIDDAISQTGAGKVVFDFGNVGFMDSSAVGLLMGRYRLLNETGGDLRVENLNSQCRRLLDLSGIGNIVSF